MFIKRRSMKFLGILILFMLSFEIINSSQDHDNETQKESTKENWESYLWKITKEDIPVNLTKKKNFKVFIRKKSVHQGKFTIIDIEAQKDIVKCFGFLGEKKISFFKLDSSRKYRAYLPFHIKHPIGKVNFFITVFFKDQFIETTSAELKVLRNIVRYIPITKYKRKRVLRRYKRKGRWKKRWVTVRKKYTKYIAPPYDKKKPELPTKEVLKEDIHTEISKINKIKKSFFSLGGAGEDDQHFKNYTDIHIPHVDYNESVLKTKNNTLYVIPIKDAESLDKGFLKEPVFQKVSNLNDSKVNQFLDKLYHFEPSNASSDRENDQESAASYQLKKSIKETIKETTYFTRHYLEWIPINYALGPFILPLKTKNAKIRLSSPFGKYRRFYYRGYLKKGYHTGIDFAVKKGTPVYASNSGQVVIADSFKARGKAIVINHGLGVSSVYYHLNSMDVNEGTFVHKGQQIGTVGTTGISTGYHLHWEIRVHGVSVDTLDFRNQIE